MSAPRIEDEGLAPRHHQSTPWSAQVPFHNISPSGRKGATIAVAVVAAGLIGFALSAPGSTSVPKMRAPSAVDAATAVAKSIVWWDSLRGRVAPMETGG